MKIFSVFILLILGISPVFSQSTISLDSFDLEMHTTSKIDQKKNIGDFVYVDCLINRSNCSSDEKSGVDFDLNDFVNLGIVDRREISKNTTNQPDHSADRMFAPLPSVDVEVFFDFDSDVLRYDQIQPLLTLARELRQIDLSRHQLVLMGHTDGVGSADYNRWLSLQRARSVAHFITLQANIPNEKIRVSGVGFDYLKKPDEPSSAANRRVQVFLVEL